VAAGVIPYAHFNAGQVLGPLEGRVGRDHDAADGSTWHALPEGISVIGSRYALVLDKIKPATIEVNLEKYVVGIGHSDGKSAAEYLQGRIDKGCLTTESTSSVSVVGPPSKKSIKFSAKLLDPYAVLLR
jgi:hypothetical protein